MMGTKEVDPQSSIMNWWHKDLMPERVVVEKTTGEPRNEDRVVQVVILIDRVKPTKLESGRCTNKNT